MNLLRFTKASGNFYQSFASYNARLDCAVRLCFFDDGEEWQTFDRNLCKYVPDILLTDEEKEDLKSTY